LLLLAYIYVDGTAGNPLLIYQGASESLKNTWIDDLNITDADFFTTSPNGWSNHDIGLKWLKTSFHSNIKGKAGNRTCLLVLDGHSSHINMAFITQATEYNIVLLVFLLHSTHKLQPLDNLFLGLLLQSTESLA